MHIVDIIAPARVVKSAQVGSKKRALELLSELLAGSDPELGQSEVFSCLLAREKLGSTGLGHGVALPHGRLAGCRRPCGALVTLAEPIDFDAIDGQPVDLLFSMVVPEESTEEHLQLLSQLAEMFSDPAFCARLRQGSQDDLLLLLTDWGSHQAGP
ncbi:MAG TPA: PTS IIA-like nitrogen regulatory protein PtsN [Gammaproteobacteria bacterium]